MKKILNLLNAKWYKSTTKGMKTNDKVRFKQEIAEILNIKLNTCQSEEISDFEIKNFAIQIKLFNDSFTIPKTKYPIYLIGLKYENNLIGYVIAKKDMIELIEYAERQQINLFTKEFNNNRLCKYKMNFTFDGLKGDLIEKSSLTSFTIEDFF